MKNKTSLVLEGGGMRGAFTAGALSWLIDNNISFDSAYGISTGAVHLVNFLTKSKRNLFDFSTKYINDKRTIGVQSFLRCGRIVDYDFLFNQLLLNEVKYDFEPVKKVKENGFIGLYELEKGRTEFFRVQDINEKHLQASTTLPMIGKACEIDDKHYLDGGITEMIPINQALKDGCNKHLIITTKPLDYVRKPAKSVVVKAMKMTYPECPSISVDYSIRHLNYVDQIKKINKLVDEKSAIYVYPTKHSNVTRIGGKEEELIELFELGYSDMEAQKEKIFEAFK